jgi:lipopolysaccharide/colanic/teichoic acid biosynthesis glycosyltransferase
MLKRLLDIVVAGSALLLLGPVLLAIALWVRCDSAGGALFRQERVGRHGRHFTIYKFRTMRTGADRSGPAITVGEDARITRAGHWLRHSKLDELPQLLNVLTGDMSLVGPRPEVPRYVAMYPAEISAIVLSVRPGITDLASIAFRNESTLLAQSADPERTYVEDILPVKLEYAARYAQNPSLWQDLVILVRTVDAVLRPARAAGGGPGQPL